MYCVVVDAVLADPSIWEALRFAATYKLKKLVIIFDLNGPDLDEEECKMLNRLTSLGFKASVTDGHDVEELTLVS